MSYYLDIAITKLEQFGIKLEDIIYDQIGWRLGGNAIYPNQKRGILLVGKEGREKKKLGYTKSIDYLECKRALSESKDLLLYVVENDTFYIINPHRIFEYIKGNRINNLKYPLKVLDKGKCPICGNDLMEHKDKFHPCANQPSNAMFECFRWRLKFNLIPLIKCGAKNLNAAKTIPQSENERWLDSWFAEEKLSLLFVGDKQISGIEAIYDRYPDWIAIGSKKVIEYDSHVRNDEERDRKVRELGFDIFKIEVNVEVLKQNPLKRQKLIHDLRLFLGFDKMQLEGV